MKVFAPKPKKSPQALGQMSLAFSAVETITTVSNRVIAKVAKDFIIANRQLIYRHS